MPVSLDLYAADLGEPATTVWGPLAGTIVGGWLVAVHAVSGGQLADMGGDPDVHNEWPPGAWQLLCQADAGPGLPKVRIWAAQFPDLKERRVTLQAANDIECHTKLYYLSSTRPGLDVADVFFPGASSSSAAGASQAVPVYSPDSTGLLIGAWISGAVVNYSSLGGLTAQTEVDSTTSTSRSGELAVSASGPSTRTAVASVAAPWAAASIVVRADPGGVVTFPAQPLRMKAELALGANPGADPAEWAALWTDITDDAQPRDGGVPIARGRPDETSTVGPSSMTLTLDNTSGRYVRLNPLSPYYGRLSKNTPAQLWVDYGLGWVLRYRGFISEFPPRSQGGQVDEHMPIRADGPTRRLGRGKVLNSPIFKAVAVRGDVLAYWPLESDGSSGLLSGQAMRTKGPLSFGTGGPPGSAGALTAPDGSSAYSIVQGMPATGAWQVSWWLEEPSGAADITPVVTWTTPNANSFRWLGYANNPSHVGQIYIEIHTDVISPFSSAVGTTDLRGMGPVLVSVRARNSGSDVAVSVFINGVLDGSTTLPGESVFPVTTTGVNNLALSAPHDIQGTVSHLSFGADNPSVSDATFAASLGWLLDAGAGHPGERATDRIRRVSNEENIPVAIVGDDGASEPMGPQPVARFLDILRDCEDVDGGVLYERRDARLAYQARAGRYNATPALTLDYSAGHVAPPLEPTDDDQHLLNDFTAARDGGGSARVLDQTHKDINGEYADGDSVNVDDDVQLPHQAGWRVHLGTADGLRYPTLVPNLNGRPALIPDWAALDIGQAAAIINPGRDLPPGEIDVFVEGYTEVIDTPSWSVTANCSPGEPWHVLALDDDVLGRLDTAGSIIAAPAGLPAATSSIVEDFEDASLAVTITGGGNLPWARSTDKPHAGAWSLKSGAITDAQTSDAIVTVPGGKTICTFWYWVSSEATFDFLRVLVDAVEQFAVSGESAGWQRGAVVVTGASTVTFRYAKDAFTGAGDDAAYIDDLAFITAETISVATKTGPAWTTAPGDMPFDITAAGEQMTVLANTAQATLDADPGFNSAGSWSASGGSFTATGVGQLTPNGSSATVQVFSTPKVAVTAGRGYTATTLLQNNATRSVNFIVNWYNASNILVSSSTLPVALTASTLASATQDLVAPATATQAEIGATMTGTPPVGHVLFIDEMYLRSTHTMTVTRSVNAVAKAHVLGEDVALAHPPTLAQ